MKYAAQLDDTDVCFAVGQFGDSLIFNDKIIEIGSYDSTLIGKTYNRDTKTFEGESI